MNHKTSLALGNRPYTTPVIQEFGNIREITQNKATGGQSDGATSGNSGNNKTNIN